MKALLIIDMQKGSFTPETPRYDSEGVIKRINQIATKFRTENLPIIYIQHDGTRHNEFVAGTHDWEILDDLHQVPSDVFINKYANDCFYRSKLQLTLDQLNADHLFICGCATDFCVESTIQSALTKDYNITIISDAHTTGKRPHLSAQKIVEHYNWVWQNMLPTQGKLQLKLSSDIL